MQRSRRKLWTFTITAGASLLVAAALVTGLFRLAVQVAPAYKEDIADYVSGFLNRPVAIEAMDLSWRGARPTLVFSGVSLLAESAVTPVLELDELELGFSLFDLVRGRVAPRAINLVGAVLELERRSDGQIFVHGLDADGQEDGAALADRLESLDRLQVSQSDLIWRDRKRGLPDYWFSRVDLRIRRGRDNALVLKLGANLPAALQGQGNLDVVLRGDLTAGNWTAEGDLEIDGLTPGPWLDAWASRRLEIVGEPLSTELEFSVEARANAAPTINVDGRAEFGALSHGAVGQGFERMALQATVGLSASVGRATVNDLQVQSANQQLAQTDRNWSAERVAVQWQRQPVGGWQLSGDASTLELADLAHWLPVFWADMPAPLAAARGRLQAVDWSAQQVADDAAPQFSAAGRFLGLALPSDGERSGFSGLNGSFTLSEADGSATLSGAGVVLEAPEHLPVPVVLDTVSAQADWTRSDQAWQFALAQIEATTLGAVLGGVVRVSQSGDGEPQLFVDSRLQANDAAALKPLMPVRWSEKLRAWLDRALVEVPVSDGQLKIDGPLVGAPYHRVPGTFDLALDLRGVTLDFAPDWPLLEGADARLRLTGPELTVDAQGGRSGGVAMGRTQARIANLFDEQVLRLTTTSRSDASTLLAYLPQTPLAGRLSGVTETLSIAGDANLQVAVNVPLRVPSQTAVEGSVTLTGAQVLYSGSQTPFRDVLGTVEFTNNGVAANQIKGLYDGRPIRLNMAPVAAEPGVTDLEFQTRIAMDDADHPWLAGVPAWALEHLAGAADWTLRTRVGGAQGAADKQLGGLHLNSELRGVQSTLPAPLDKPDAETALPLRVRIRPSPQHWRATGALGDRLAFAAQAPRRTNAALTPDALDAVHVSLGTSTPPPVQAGMSASGVLPLLDVSAWQAILPKRGSVGSGEAKPNIALDVQLGELRLGKVRLPRQRVSGGRDNGAWNLGLRGSAEGQLRWDGTSADPIVLRLAELRMLEIKPAMGAPNAEAAAPEPATTASGTVLNPSEWLALDIDAQRVMVGQADFGRVILRTERRRNGATLRQFSVDGSMLNGQADGYWVRNGGVSRGGFEGAFSSPNIARVQDALGLVRTVDAKQTRAAVKFGWPESPTGLDWTQATGSIEVNIDDGVLATVEPGAGRMVGLLSFNALPRRLLLDFRDVVDSGMKFDSISGHFRVGGGRAETDDLQVRAPSADISVRGSVGLAQRTYDQTITVQPDLSSGVTLAGTVFGGPAVGAILLVAQELFDKPLNQAGQVAYHLGGTWDDPIVTRPNQLPEDPDNPKPSPDRGPRS